MSNITKIFGSATTFLHHCYQTKNLTSIKNFYSHFLRTNLLSVSPKTHTNLIFAYTTSLSSNNIKTLTNCLKLINPENPIPFNVLISEFCRNGFALYALKTLSFMHLHSVALDTYALCSSLTASISIKDVNFGKQIHTHVVKLGYICSVFVGSALIDLYAKLSLVNEAAILFDEIPVKNTVCANALLSGFAEAKLWGRVIELSRKMPYLDLDYDHFSLSAMLQASAGLSAIELGRQVHAYLIRKIYDVKNDVFLQSSLIEMYGKCGFVDKALQVFNLAGFRFEGEKIRDIVLWTSMLGAYGRNGQFNEVIGLYNKMLKEGIVPDPVAFLTVISACGHTGQVNLGIVYFESMTNEYKLNPGVEHYSCVVDLLCRAGELDKAWKMVNEMLAKGHENFSISMWGALLSASEECGNLELGKLAAQMALKLEPENIGIHVMLSNLYARFGMWDEINQLRRLMKEKRLKKDVGSSWIEATS